VWWGLWLVPLTAGGTWWTVIGPIVMSAILIRGTSKGDETQGDTARAAYVRRTSGFVPLPPRSARQT
jgi:steroid 5-alpha reductase family enzyme